MIGLGNSLVRVLQVVSGRTILKRLSHEIEMDYRRMDGKIHRLNLERLNLERLNPEWTEPRMDPAPNGTQRRRDSTPNGTQPRMGLNPEWD
jgi:hypothetical protein